MRNFLFSKEVKAFGVLFVLMALLTIVNGVPFLFGDSYGYFHVGKSILTQTNYPSMDKPEYFDYTGHAVNIFKNGYITPYSIGQTFLWFPALAASSFVNNGSIYNEYFKSFNGHSFYDGLGVLISSVFFAFLGIFFSYLFLKELGFSKKVSFYCVLSIFISLHLISYTFEQPGYSHVYEFFTYSAFLYFFVKFFITKRPLFIYLASIFAGLLVLIRIVDVVLILPPFLFILFRIKSRKILFITFLILGLFASILLWYNNISYGSPFTVGYNVSGQSGFVSNFNLLNFLFSDTRGLFVWSPIVILSFFGLIFYSKKSKTSLVFFIIPIILLLTIYSFWNNWWGGVSAGQRFLIVLAPVFALGLAYFYVRFKFKVITNVLVLILTLFSLVVSLLYRFTPVLRINTDFRDSNQSLTSPFIEDYRVSDLFNYHYNLVTGSKGPVDYLVNLKDSLNGGRSLGLLLIGQTDPLVRIENLSLLKFKIHFIPNNVNADKSINTFITLKYLNNSATYLIPNKSYKEYSNAEVSCTQELICTSIDINLIKSNYTENQLKFAPIQFNLSASVYGEDQRINFINLKLK